MRLRRQPSRPMDHVSIPCPTFCADIGLSQNGGYTLQTLIFIGKIWEHDHETVDFWLALMPIRAYRPLKKSTACKLVRRQWGSQRGSNDLPLI